MAGEQTLRGDGVRIGVTVPTSLADGTGDARAVFDAVWSRLPPFEEDNAFVALDDDGGVFLKGQRIRPRVHPEALLQAGRLVRETRFMRLMAAAGVPVPEVLAHGVERRFGVPVRSFLLLRLVPDTRDLRFVVRNTSPGERDDLWGPVGRMVAALHATRLFHRDLTARNVLVRRSDGAVDVHLIDCPRAERGWFPPRRGFLRRSDVFRLGRSIMKAGGEEDEVRSLLEAAGVARPEIIQEMIGRSLRRGGDRTARTRLWVMFGV